MTATAPTLTPHLAEAAHYFNQITEMIAFSSSLPSTLHKFCYLTTDRIWNGVDDHHKMSRVLIIISISHPILEYSTQWRNASYLIYAEVMHDWVLGSDDIKI